jgi:hypothetical protein
LADYLRLEKAFEYCQGLAMNIESGMWAFFEKSLNKEYGRKFRQLQTSLRNDENFELRLQLLSAQIDPLKVHELTNEQLLPPSRKHQIEQSKRRYFEQAVFLPDKEDMKKIIKTTQGLEYISTYEYKK